MGEGKRMAEDVLPWDGEEFIFHLLSHRLLWTPVVPFIHVAAAPL